MASLIQKAILFFKPAKVVHETLDPETVKRNAIISNLAKENAELKGTLASIEIEKAKQRETETDKAQEDEVKLTLQKRAKEISTKESVRFFSLRDLFGRMLKDDKFRNNLTIFTWDRKTPLAKFSNIGFSSDGGLILLGEVEGKTKVIHKTENLRDMFQSVSAIEHDVGRGILPINLDSEGSFIPNLQMETLSEIVPVGEGFHYSRAKKKPLYEYVKELQDQISDLSTQLEEAETTSQNLQNVNDELMRSNRIMNKTYNAQRSNLTETEKQFTGMNALFSEQSKELAQQRLNNISLEETKELLDTVNEALREKAEREGTKIADEKAMEKIGRVINQMQNIMVLGQSQQSSPTQPQIQPNQPNQEGGNT